MYSGYSTVIGLLNSCRNVTANPFSVSIGCGLNSYPDHDQGSDDGVDRRDRQEHLPAEPHQLVVAEARNRRANPDEDRDGDEELEDEPERSERRPGTLPAAEEERHRERGEHD